MSTQTGTNPRPKAGDRGNRNRPKRRAPVKSGSGIPILPVVVGVILLALFIGIGVYAYINSRPNNPPTVAGVPCDKLEQTQVHYHTALQILYHGNLAPLPADIGIQGDPNSPTCFYWLHVHPANEDVIHVESPANRVFTVGDFFQVWNAWSLGKGEGAQHLDATHVSTFTLAPGDTVVVYVDIADGKGPQLYTGDPNQIVLKAHEVITIEVAPPTVSPPPSFTFAGGL
jgi:hypothetical protein